MGLMKVSNTFWIDVVDHEGYFIRHVRVDDTVWPELEDVKQDKENPAVIQVLYPVRDEKGHPIDAPEANSFRKPMLYKDCLYDLDWFGGTSVKDRKTYGVKQGVGEYFRKEFLQYAEAITKMARALLPHGVYGACKGDIVIQFAADGTKVGDLPVEDGVSYIGESFAAAFPLTGDFIHLGALRQNAQFWQHLPWELIVDDVTKIEVEFFARIIHDIGEGTFEQNLLAEADGLSGVRKELVALNPRMRKHPLIVDAVSADQHRWYVEVATTPALEADARLAIPTTAETPLLAEGHWAFGRFPGISERCVRHVHITKDMIKRQAAERALMDKVKGAMVITITAVGLSIKTNAVIVPDDMLPAGVDVVCSSSNAKLGSRRFVAANNEKMNVPAAIVVAIQRYDRTSVMAIPVDLWKIVAGDYDGDLIAIYNIDGYKGIQKALDTQPASTNVKPPKPNKLPPTMAPEVLTNAMGQNLGFATNVRSKTYARAVTRRQQIVERTMRWTGMDTVIGLNSWMTDIIQQQVESIKNLAADTKAGRKTLSKTNSELDKVFGGSPGYITWKSNTWAFVQGFPCFRSELPDEILTRAKDEPDFKATDQWRSSVPDDCDGTIAMIFRLVRDRLQSLWDRMEIEEAEPLCQFRNWAPSMEEWDVERARPLLNKWTVFQAGLERERQAKRYNPDEIEDVRLRHAEWSKICREKADEIFKGDQERAATALWRLAHGNHTSRATAAAVFIAYPEFCTRVVKANAVDNDNGICRTPIIGMKHHWPKDEVPNSLECNVEIIKTKQGRYVVLALEPETIKGIYRTSDLYPDWTIGVVPVLEKSHIGDGMIDPSVGKFHMIAVGGGKVWVATLHPLTS